MSEESKSKQRRDERAAKAQMDPSRKRWLRTDGLQFVHYEIPDGEKDRGEGSVAGLGPSHVLAVVFLSNPKKPLSIDFSMMSKAEIEATREFILSLLAEAQEVCEHRDKKAQEAFEDGDDSNYRLYRTIPKVVERKGPVGQHSEGAGG